MYIRYVCISMYMNVIIDKCMDRDIKKYITISIDICIISFKPGDSYYMYVIIPQILILEAPTHSLTHRHIQRGFPCIYQCMFLCTCGSAWCGVWRLVIDRKNEKSLHIVFLNLCVCCFLHLCLIKYSFQLREKIILSLFD